MKSISMMRYSEKPAKRRTFWYHGRVKEIFSASDHKVRLAPINRIDGIVENRRLKNVHPL